jgi:3-dehydroquinate synthase
MSAMKKLDIKSGRGSYEVHFLPTLKACLASAQSESSFFLVDEKVYGLYRGDFAALEPARCITWVANETNKTFANIEPLFEKLMKAGFKKNSHLVVVGGGILQDVGGFVASVIYRGVTWDLIPTTLLAQADSCIGAKTSINLTFAKNLLGTFCAPRRVWLTTEVLKTLSPGDIHSGLAEAVKLAMVEGGENIDWMRANLPHALEGRGLEEFLYRALLIKKRYIEEDEFDKGIRNLLNYGHTFGHAFEAVTNYEIPHGIAVGLGMRAASFFSVQLGLAPKSYFDDTTALMKPLTDAYVALLKKSPASIYVQVMKSDKKNTSMDITLILGKGHGGLAKHPLPAEKTEQMLGVFLTEA